jgi:hypothetical protein
MRATPSPRRSSARAQPETTAVVTSARNHRAAAASVHGPTSIRCHLPEVQAKSSRQQSTSAAHKAQGLCRDQHGAPSFAMGSPEQNVRAASPCDGSPPSSDVPPLPPAASAWLSAAPVLLPAVPATPPPPNPPAALPVPPSAPPPPDWALEPASITPNRASSTMQAAPTKVAETKTTSLVSSWVIVHELHP